MAEERTERRPSSSEVRQRIGPAIRRLRQQQGLSLSDLAERTGISVSYLSRLEKGRSVPSFTLLSRLGNELGVDIGFFVDTEREAQDVDQALEQELGGTSIPQAVWPEIFGMSIEARKALLEYFEGHATGSKRNRERAAAGL
ncbi:MAG TPA: helix-turn-helix transcriptional regulator [Thermomicrobiaceae bacterium]|nr:helix-turn-helix transcriptional regulator [Thermomicrobiaceae bacterium]